MTITTDWLVPMTLFWFAVAIYFGGIDMEVSGGSGLRQFKWDTTLHGPVLGFSVRF